MKLISDAICARGLVRSENQDNMYVNGVFRENVSDNSVFRYADAFDNQGLYAVADGMGGEKHGEIAALEAVRGMGSIDLADGCEGIARHIVACNAAICGLMRESGVRIGSTFVGLYIIEKRAELINIGDSRLYLQRGKELSQLSRDHTSVRQMLELGAITQEEARMHPNRHKLSQHLGIFPSEMIIEPYTVSLEIEIGDIFLLCSDGLTDMVYDDEIKAILEAPSSIIEKTAALYEEAINNGGKDNITIILVQAIEEISAKKGKAQNAVVEPQSPPLEHKKKENMRSKVPIILALIALLLFFIAVAIWIPAQFSRQAGYSPQVMPQAAPGELPATPQQSP